MGAGAAAVAGSVEPQGGDEHRGKTEVERSCDGAKSAGSVPPIAFRGSIQEREEPTGWNAAVAEDKSTIVARTTIRRAPASNQHGRPRKKFASQRRPRRP